MQRNQNKKTTNVAIIGCGTVTQTNYAKTFPSIPGIAIRYVYDINPDAAKKMAKEFGAKVGTPEEIYRNTDAVIVATPPATHYQIVKELLRYGRMVVCEKPFVGTTEEAEDLVRSAQSRGVELYVGHFRRSFPSVQLARSIIATGGLGEVNELLIIEGGRFGWHTQSDYVMTDPFGGVLFDTGSHTIDMALYAAGLDEGPFSVKVDTVRRNRPEPAHAIEALFSFESEKGSGRGRILLSRFESLANRIRIRMKNGTVEFPAGLSNKVRLSGPKGTTVLTAGNTDTGLMDYFALLYHQIFNTGEGRIFSARNFINLTRVLEAVTSGGV